MAAYLSAFACLLALLIPSLASAAAADANSLTADFHLTLAKKNPEKGFRLFLSRFRKNYTSAAEFRRRFKVFTENLVRAAEHQLLDPSAVHGVTQFSDLTPEEFAQRHLGLRAKEVLESASAGAPQAEILPTEGLPEEFDWREHGAVSPVKNQGMCGSCYAFSAVGAVEGAHFLKTGQLVSLSEQQIVDCDHQCDPVMKDVCDSGCQGGLMNNVLSYLEATGGLQTEADYPYKGYGATCKFDANKVVATVQKFVALPVDEEQIVANLVKYGPVAVAINAGWMQSYVKGVSCPLACDRKALNHGVLLVGYGKHGYSIARLKYKDYWIIKNSWGTGWGEDGYYRICSGNDECGVDTMASAVIAVDGDKVPTTKAGAEKLSSVAESHAKAGAA